MTGFLMEKNTVYHNLLKRNSAQNPDEKALTAHFRDAQRKNCRQRHSNQVTHVHARVQMQYNHRPTPQLQTRGNM